MISATGPYLVAEANRQKKPVYIVRIQDYPRAFSNKNFGTVPPLPSSITGIPSWITPPVSPVTGEKLLWIPITDTPTITVPPMGSPPCGTITVGPGPFCSITRTRQTAGLTSPIAKWSSPIVSTPAVASSVTRIYAVTRGSWDGNWGSPVLVSPTYGPLDGRFIDSGSAFSGVLYREISGDFSPGAFPWSTFDLKMGLESSLAVSTPSTFTVTELGFLVYYDSSPSPSTVYPWLISIEDHTLTINDLDGGADLADLVFNVQDRGSAITSDFPGFVFEGHKVVLSKGEEGMDFADFLTLFTGKIDAIDSANGNTEYMFTCPDIRQELTKVIYGVADDGRATDSDHPRTLNGNPLDILIAALETEVGLAPDDIDLAKIEHYRDTIYSGLQFKFVLTSPPAAKDFIENELMKPLGAYIWSNNLGQVTVNFYYPLSIEPVIDFKHSNPADPADNLMEVPEAGIADLINEVSIRFDYSADDKPQVEVVQQDAASVAKFGLYGQLVIEARGLRAGLQGSFIGSLTAFLIFLRYGNKQLCFGSSSGNSSPVLALDSAFRVEPGDIVTVTNPLVPDRNAGVMGISAKTFVVMDRTWHFFECTVEFKLLEVDVSAFRQFLITGNSEAAYTAVSSADKAKYMFQSGDDDKYSNGDPANTLA